MSQPIFLAKKFAKSIDSTDKFVDLEQDIKKPTYEDYFYCDYDVSKKPIWFLPGLFVDRQLQPLPKQRGVVDNNDFNVINEGYPGTGGSRAYYVPTYGRIESILPGHWLFTCAISPDSSELEAFFKGQTFMLGKKRTMMQVVELSEIVEGQQTGGMSCTPYLQIPLEEINEFSTYEIIATTARYILIRGQLQKPVPFWLFSKIHIAGLMQEFHVPEFYIKNKLAI